MASLGHVFVGIACAETLRHVQEKRDQAAPPRLRSWLLLGALSLLPDADVLAFGFGVPYGAPFGHRGATHSLAFALAVSALAYAAAPLFSYARKAFALAVLGAVGSHGPLDMLTDGGKGIALWWPFSAERLFFPWRPIPVAPIGAHMLSPRGAHVLLMEFVYFAPMLIAVLVVLRVRRTRQ